MKKKADHELIMSASNEIGEDLAKELAKQYGAELFEEIIPYFKKSVKIYQSYKNYRIHLFFLHISKNINKLNDADRKKFDKYMDDPVSQELLVEYSDTVLRTTSKTATRALAILYGDYNNMIFSKEFKIHAFKTLDGIAEDTLRLFVLLHDIFIDSKAMMDGPYPIYHLYETLLAENKELKDIIGYDELAFSYIQELVARGFFLPDHSSGRAGGEEWAVAFGFSRMTSGYKRLISMASEI